MNKKMNTVLFTIGATIFNLISMLIILLIPLGILLLIFRENLLQAGIFPIVLIILFFGALVANFFLYGLVMRKLSEKINMDKYFEPFFKKKKNQ